MNSKAMEMMEDDKATLPISVHLTELNQSDADLAHKPSVRGKERAASLDIALHGVEGIETRLVQVGKKQRENISTFEFGTGDGFPNRVHQWFIVLYGRRSHVY